MHNEQYVNMTMQLRPYLIEATMASYLRMQRVQVDRLTLELQYALVDKDVINSMCCELTGTIHPVSPLLSPPHGPSLRPRCLVSPFRCLLSPSRPSLLPCHVCVLYCHLLSPTRHPFLRLLMATCSCISVLVRLQTVRPSPRSVSTILAGSTLFLKESVEDLSSQLVP